MWAQLSPFEVPMTYRFTLSLAFAGLVAVGLGAQDKPKVQVPQPGVPQIMTLEGEFVRVAYNNEGYAIIGYKLANNSIGENWMLLEFGTTVLGKTPDYKLKREHLSLETPDGKTIPLPTMEEYRKADTRALQMREKVIRDSINYFPVMASRPCRIGFFSDVDSRAVAWDEVELSNNRACLGRLYFNVPGGIVYGQYWLNVKFENSLVRVPFRILTKDEEKLLSKNYKDIKKQVDEAFKPKQ
jgi:hypothetical protein